MAAGLLVLLSFLAASTAQSMYECDSVTSEDIENVAKVIFVYGHGQPNDTKMAIAFTITNRRDSMHFPNTIGEVIDQTCKIGKNGKEKKCFRALGRQNRKWDRVKQSNNMSYQKVTLVAREVLCGGEDDPTGGATTFSRQAVPRFLKAPRNVRPTGSGLAIGEMYFFNLEPKMKRGGRGNGGRARRQNIDLNNITDI